MAKPRPQRRFDAEFTLGGEQAEADSLLEEGFYESGHYSALASRDDMRCFVIGRTGGGKSAALQHLQEVHATHVVRVSPEDLSLTYITDLAAIKYLTSLNVHLDPLFIALWKHVLLVEIIKHRYNVDSPEAKQNFLVALRDKIKKDPSKKAALEYLEDFGGKFWCETDVRLREITTRFEEQVNAEAKGQLGLAAGGASAGASTATNSVTEVREEEVARFQRIVNETQLPRLNKMMSVLNEDILESPQDFTYVVIDDLDRDWVDDQLTNDLVRCLFRTVLELKRVRNLKVLVALRTNIFDQLNVGARTGGQEEKFRSLSLHMRWSRTELAALLDERARAAALRFGGGAIDGIYDLLPVPNRTRGSALEYILDRTLMRPRDAVAYVNECFATAAGKARLSWDDIKLAERPYSHKRLLALRDEWARPYPGLEPVFQTFRSAASVLDRDEYTRRLEAVALLSAEPGFLGSGWLLDMTSKLWEANAKTSWCDQFQPLTRLLFRIGFIGCSKTPHDEPVYSYQDPDYAESTRNLDEPAYFHVHPAFRTTLDIEPRQQRGKAR